MLRALRIIAAVSMFAALNLFFWGFVDGLMLLADIQFVPACLALNVVAIIFILAVTAVFGRIYCSIVCPLGILQDFILWIRRKIKKKKFEYHPNRLAVRAGFTAVFILLSIFGAISFAGIIEPYSVYGRIATHVFEPIAALCANAAADFFASRGVHCILKTELFIRGWSAFGVACASLLALGILATMRGRLFCNTVCPVGAVLGLVAAKAPVKIRLNEESCVKCGQCARVCKAECIDLETKTVDQSRCVRCFDCIGACGKGAVKWK